MCLLVYLFSFVNYVFQSLPVFVEIFFLSYCGKNSLYTLNTSPLSGIYMCCEYFISLWLTFFLMVTFEEQNF